VMVSRNFLIFLPCLGGHATWNFHFRSALVVLMLATDAPAGAIAILIPAEINA
jgi:hypothetical protein